MVEHFLVPSAAQCEGVWLPGPRPGPGCAVNPFDPGMIRTSRSFIGTMPTICGHIPLHRGRSITRIADRGRISGCDTANALTVGPFPGGFGSGLLRGFVLTTERHRPGQPGNRSSRIPARGKRPVLDEPVSTGIVRCGRDAGSGDDPAGWVLAYRGTALNWIPATSSPTGPRSPPTPGSVCVWWAASDDAPVTLMDTADRVATSTCCPHEGCHLSW